MYNIKRNKTFVRTLIALLAISMLIGTPIAAWAEPESDTAIETARSKEELTEKVSAADSDAFFELDVAEKSASLATNKVTSEVTDILSGNGKASDKQDMVIDALEESGLYVAEAEGNNKVEVISIYACQRILLDIGKDEDIETFGAVRAAYYDGQYLLSYADEARTKAAYEALCDKYGEGDVLLDVPVKVMEIKSWGTAYMKMDTQKETAASGAEVTVAVIDTGINQNHEIFEGRTILPGYDYVNNDPDPADDAGHGTSVAGIIAESTPENINILPIKALNSKGTGSLVDIFYGIEYAVNNGANIINLSLGAFVENEATFRTCERYLKAVVGSNDVLIVCASGNDGKNLDNPGVLDFPGESKETISVGAFSENGTICSFSNYGGSIDFAAPGSGLIVANCDDTSGYRVGSGTSFATPHVTAACALIKAEKGGDGDAVKAELIERSIDMGDEGKDAYFGNGCPVFTQDDPPQQDDPPADPNPKPEPDPIPTVSPSDISQAEITGITDREYTGAEISQEPEVKMDEAILTEGTDYTIDYKNNINAGTATITITGIGTYTGSADCQFSINPKSISPVIELSETSYVYDGFAKTPDVSVKDGTHALIGDADYEVVYPKDRRNAGAYTIKVTLKGNYKGSGSAQFVILQSTSDITAVLSQSSYTFDGSIKTPGVTVKKGDLLLTKDTDYDLEYSSGRIDAGQYNVTVNLKGNYSGSLTETFRISPKTLTPTVTLSEDTYVFDETSKSPAAEVKDGSKILTENKDYTLIYPEERINAGTYYVAAILKGNYSGSGKGKFTIAPKQISPSVSLSQNAFTYDGNVKTPGVTVKYGSKTIKDYRIAYPQGRSDAGTYTVSVSLDGNYSGKGSAIFAIYKVSSPVKAAAKTATVSYKTLKRKSQTLQAKKLMSISGARGDIAYYLISVNKSSYNNYFKINRKTGAVTIKKGCKKGKYTMTIHVTDAGDNNYRLTTRKINCKIKVK